MRAARFDTHLLPQGSRTDVLDPWREQLRATGRDPDDAITMNDLAALDIEIRPGDIVLVRTGYDRDYGREDYGRPYLADDLVDLFVRTPVSCLGIDASGIEKYRAESQPSHLKLFSAGIPIVEELTNLDAVPPGRFTFIGLPLRIDGADASPIRAVALVEER